MNKRLTYKLSDDIPGTKLKKDDVCIISGCAPFDIIIIIRLIDNSVWTVCNKHLPLLIEVENAN